MLYSIFSTKVFCGTSITEDFATQTRLCAVTITIILCIEGRKQLKEIGLNINTKKTKIMTNNANTENPVTIEEMNIEEVKKCIYLERRLRNDVKSQGRIYSAEEHL